MDKKSKSAFVICPIGQPGSEPRRHSDMVYNAVLRPVFEKTDYELARADFMSKPGIITNDVVNAIINSDVCVADLTGLNANVFYELGIAHSAKRPTIHIASLATSLPFDNLGYRAILFDPFDWHSQEGARKELQGHLQAVGLPSFKASNPVTSAQAEFEISKSDDPQKQAIQDVLRRLTSLESKATSRDLIALSSPMFDQSAALTVAAGFPWIKIVPLLVDLANSADSQGSVSYEDVTAAVQKSGYNSGMWVDDLERAIRKMRLDPAGPIAETLKSSFPPSATSGSKEEQ